jgi:hypothetical protein
MANLFRVKAHGPEGVAQLVAVNGSAIPLLEAMEYLHANEHAVP